ncbi:MULTISPECIES: hypothetical protein [Myxococcus]|nr:MULTISPECIES: hypothetical protein [Myxococcus]QZZ52057.1 hypothetical protein MyxoNM_22875 [Myxococcus xanthus]UYI11793.1 hypothetical protein N3T43_22200 [Myxococcus xanthus]UYI19162.1 hypothetical protein N1129_22650 [Myxococcus xanthus]SDW80586.1 hypothetical protein SAMN05444383_103570 [Myxococcus xanthus]
MQNQNNPLNLSCVLVALALGCSSSATGTASRRDAYALATCTDTVTCCIQRNPGMPEACGLTASEAASHMAGVKMVIEAAEEAPAEWDDTHNANLPEWKRRCIRAYGDCQEFDWTGSCHDCLRSCEGQQAWPEDKCSPRRKKKR